MGLNAKPSLLTLRLTFYSIGELGLGSVANCARCWCSVIHALATDAVANGPTVVGWYSGLTTSTENRRWDASNLSRWDCVNARQRETAR
jgi:hypothetical protein